MHSVNSKNRRGCKAKTAPIDILGRGHRWPGTARIDANVLAAVLHKEGCRLGAVKK